jgi:sporulation protein YlmC with PRC-barrel domain
VQDVNKRKVSTKEKSNAEENKNMKRKLQIIIRASAALILAHSAPAQDTPNRKTKAPDDTRVCSPHAQRANQLNDATKASDVIGMTVKNYLDEKLGKVKDLAVDVESGRIVLVILSTRGFIGIGDTLTAVPPETFQHDVTYRVLRLLDTDKEKLKGAPKLEMSNWAEYCDSNHLSAVYRYYDEESAFRFIQKGHAVLDGQPGLDGSPDTASTRQADGTWKKDRISSGGNCMIPASRLRQIQKSSKLLGMPVQNLQDEKVGHVENLLVDLPSGRIVAVIVSSGGFLGIDGELSAVPPTALRFTPDRDALQLDASKGMLSLAPHFKANQWPDFSQPSYADVVYRAYHVEPYFTTNAITEADDTARNIRDRDDRTLTPLDQGNSQADVDTTARIRQAINAANNMSVDARNVKIITMNGRVTLRGPVDTIEEKNLIGEIADRIARSENVDNQLEVKLTASNNN